MFRLIRGSGWEVQIRVESWQLEGSGPEVIDSPGSTRGGRDLQEAGVLQIVSSLVLVSGCVVTTIFAPWTKARGGWIDGAHMP